MKTHANHAGHPESSWVLLVTACLLPLAILFLAFGLGWAVPWWLFVVALLLCFLMPFWMMDTGKEEEERPGRDAANHRDGTDHARAIATAIPSTLLEVRGWEATPVGVILRGRLRAAAEDVRRGVAERVEQVLGREALVMLHEDAGGQPQVLVADPQLEQALRSAVPRQRPFVNVALFAATIVTTTLAGAAHAGVDLLAHPGQWTRGLPYGLGVMLILGIHEMGHYVAARRHGVQVSLPYFIPLPFALGTFGAFISMPPLLRDRRQLFDIGVAGPLAGLAVAVPALFVGLRWSTVLPADPPATASMMQGVGLDASVMLALVAKAALGTAVGQGHFLQLHPLAFAGWLGLMLTALNLIPVGQLDGGHIAHALLGRGRSAWLGNLALFTMVGLGIFVWSGLLFWAFVVYFIAGRPGFPPVDDVTPLGGARPWIGGLALAVLVLILTPVPHALFRTLGLHCPYL